MAAPAGGGCAAEVASAAWGWRCGESGATLLARREVRAASHRIASHRKDGDLAYALRLRSVGGE